MDLKELFSRAVEIDGMDFPADVLMDHPQDPDAGEPTDQEPEDARG